MTTPTTMTDRQISNRIAAISEQIVYLRRAGDAEGDEQKLENLEYESDALIAERVRRAEAACA